MHAHTHTHKPPSYTLIKIKVTYNYYESPCWVLLDAPLGSVGFNGLIGVPSAKAAQFLMSSLGVVCQAPAPLGLLTGFPDFFLAIFFSIINSVWSTTTCLISFFLCRISQFPQLIVWWTLMTSLDRVSFITRVILAQIQVDLCIHYTAY